MKGAGEGVVEKNRLELNFGALVMFFILTSGHHEQRAIQSIPIFELDIQFLIFSSPELSDSDK